MLLMVFLIVGTSSDEKVDLNGFLVPKIVSLTTLDLQKRSFADMMAKAAQVSPT